MKALILSAGLGTRLLPYSALTPKPLFTLAGEPLLGIHIRMLAAAGCEAVMVNTHHRKEKIEAFIAHRSFSTRVGTRHEPRILGTGGAIKNLTDFWDARPFIVLNADIHHTFDLAEIYAFHCSHPHPVTLVLWDDPEFNTVAVNREGRVTAFGKTAAGVPEPAERRLTFTGIQVLDPRVVDQIPAGRPVHSIDVYRRMMAAGETIEAFMPEGGSWSDLGTPQRYRAAARRMAAGAAFAAASDGDCGSDIAFEPLAGDGSERSWFRLRSGTATMIMCDHGLREQEGFTEVDAFVSIGRHLRNLQVPVPAILFEDRFAGIVVLEDLGDRSLQLAVGREDDPRRILAWYRQIIVELIEMSLKGLEGFEDAWAYQSVRYDRRLILEKECRYFVDAFLLGVLGLKGPFRGLQPEFEHLADQAMRYAHEGLMHRDLQSRNIMVADGRFFLIDFQGSRRGPLQYDLASLLRDPYVNLPEQMQAELLDFCVAQLARRGPVDADAFRTGYRYCALSRNLQVLGAFGHLSRVRGKTHFEAYVRPAVSSLARLLTGFGPAEFAGLRRVVNELVLPRLPTEDGV